MALAENTTELQSRIVIVGNGPDRPVPTNPSFSVVVRSNDGQNLGAWPVDAVPKVGDLIQIGAGGGQATFMTVKHVAFFKTGDGHRYQLQVYLDGNHINLPAH